MKSRRDAGPDQFNRFLARLDGDSTRAWQAYDSLRRKLVVFFRYQCPLQAEDLAEEVLDRVARKAAEQEIRDLGDFAFGVARNLRREMLRRKVTWTRIAGFEMVGGKARPNTNPEDSIIETLDLGKTIDDLAQCLERLKPDDRKLLLEYYSPDDENIAECRLLLARQLGVSMGSLRNRMLRLREKLEACCNRRSSMRKKSMLVKARRHLS